MDKFKNLKIGKKLILSFLTILILLRYITALNTLRMMIVYLRLL